MKRIFTIFAVFIMLFGVGACVATQVFSKSEVSTAYALVLKQGSRGSEVSTMQKKLKNWGYYTGSVDGIFGAKTTSAVKYFQRKNGLVADGIVGVKTLKALGMSNSSSSSSSSSSNNGYSSNDVYLLAKLIHAEARGETYQGQVAVGAVVLNRVRSSSFPNTISGVIYQKYAFTCVADGQINLEPGETAKKAAKDAMNGWDPSYGALYYYNPKVATSGWIFTRQTTVIIGNHTFAI